MNFRLGESLALAFRRVLSVAGSWFALFGAVSSKGEVSLASLFQDRAVLQRDCLVPIWGWADPGEAVRIGFQGQTAQTVADAEGNWRLTIGPFSAGVTGELVCEGKNRVVLHDVAVGEVWLCSGQSNMQFRLKELEEGLADIAVANFPDIRQFRVRAATASQPAQRTDGQWLSCSPETAGEFSAVGYFFAREITARMQMPVGLINASVGGTAIESWISREVLASDPEFAVALTRWAEVVKDLPQKKIEYQRALKAWENSSPAEMIALARQGRRKPSPPREPGNRDEPASLFNAMIAPLVGYPLRGILWYQGEGNAERPKEYETLFPALITDWRRRWREERMPFYFVQLAGFDSKEPRADWAGLREAQTRALQLPETGMVVALDLGDAEDIHPQRKKEVGQRLALLARAKLYGERVAFSGPVFRQARREGSALLAEFDFAASGWEIRGERAKGFEIAGSDGKFLPADVLIEGARLRLSSAQVRVPVAARYGWKNFSEANIYNRDGLPLAPFIYREPKQ